MRRIEDPVSNGTPLLTFIFYRTLLIWLEDRFDPSNVVPLITPRGLAGFGRMAVARKLSDKSMAGAPAERRDAGHRAARGAVAVPGRHGSDPAHRQVRWPMFSAMCESSRPTGSARSPSIRAARLCGEAARHKARRAVIEKLAFVTPGNVRAFSNRSVSGDAGTRRPRAAHGPQPRSDRDRSESRRHACRRAGAIRCGRLRRQNGAGPPGRAAAKRGLWRQGVWLDQFIASLPNLGEGPPAG